MKNYQFDQLLRYVAAILIFSAIAWVFIGAPSKEDACNCESVLAYATSMNVETDNVQKCLDMFDVSGNDIDEGRYRASKKCQE